MNNNDITKSTEPPTNYTEGCRVLSKIITTMTEAKDLDTVVTAMEIARTEARHLIDNTRTKKLAKLDAINNTMEEAHKKALNQIANAKEQDDKTLTNATTERKGAPDQATIAENQNPGGT